MKFLEGTHGLWDKVVNSLVQLEQSRRSEKGEKKRGNKRRSEWTM